MHKFKVGKKVYFNGSRCEITKCVGKEYFYFIRNTVSGHKWTAYEHELTTFNFELGDIVKHITELDALFKVVDFGNFEPKPNSLVKVVLVKGECHIFSDKKFYLFESDNLCLIERKSELTPEEWFARKHEVPKI